MACGSCGTGKPGGCKSNGGCSTGGCNRMNVHDWLANLPIADVESECKVVEVSFKQGSRKDFFRNLTLQYFEKGELITVEGVSGHDVGEVSLTGELVRLQMKKRGVNEFSAEIKKVLRKSTDKEIEAYQYQKSREAKILARSREIAIQLKLQMKLSEIEIQADGKKATFFYSADDRVDFREMIKTFALEFKLKVEMRQIGIRQEAAKVGGIGSCGRELCCSTWLTDFKSVNTTAARYQNLSINQSKLSGQCGRLKCCLNFELDTYLDGLQHFPDNADTLEIAKGNAFLIKKDIFKNIMWYVVQGGGGHQYPLAISRVKEIKRLNNQGIKPEGLEPMDLTAGKQKEVEPEYADLVGQISLKSLEKGNKKEGDRRNKNKGRDNNRRNPEAGDASAAPTQRPPQNNVVHAKGNNQGNPQSGQPNNRNVNNPPRDGNRGRNEQRPPREQQAPGQQRPQQPNVPRPPRENNAPGQPPRQNQQYPNQRPPRDRNVGNVPPPSANENKEGNVPAQNNKPTPPPEPKKNPPKPNGPQPISDI